MEIHAGQSEGQVLTFLVKQSQAGPLLLRYHLCHVVSLQIEVNISAHKPQTNVNKQYQPFFTMNSLGLTGPFFVNSYSDTV